MTALYQLATEYRQMADKLHDLDLPDEVINDTLESAGGDLQEKATNVAKFVRNLEADADKIEEAAKAMLDRAKAYKRKAESIKRYLHTNMETAGISKIESPWFVLSIRNNQESVVIDDESDIPSDYLREIPAKYEPDKKLIKSAIQDGYAVPGCHLQRTTRLEIK